MNLLLVREASEGDKTFGVLYLDGRFFCHTLEDRVRPAKIAGETAISAGNYRVTITPSPRFGRPLPLLIDVPGFTGIRIHPGNTASDTEGCILPGYVRGPDRVLQSRAAFDALFLALRIAGGADITIRPL